MQSIIVTTLYLITVCIPLVFTTINYELFEFPKFLLLITATIVITVSWALHIYNKKDKEIIPANHNKLITYSLVTILVSQTIATIFSIHPYTSFWGYYSRFHQGLLTTICYTIIYLAGLKWMNKKSTQKLFKISIWTAFIISLYAILERFGIDKSLWVQDVVNRPFSTLGQPNWLAAYLIPNLFLVLYLSVSSKKISSPNILYSIFYVLILTALLLTKSRSGLLAFAFAYSIYWLITAKNFGFKKIKTLFIQYSIFSFFVLFVVGSAYTPSLTSIVKKELVAQQPTTQGTQLESGGTESGDIRKIVWTGALRLIEKYPILGTGPETFAYSYYWERPVEHNYTSEWDFLYNKAHNEYLNMAATTGLIGLVSYLFWHYALAKLSLTKIPKSKKVDKSIGDSKRSLYPVLASSVAGFAITNFFGFSVIPVYLMMILLSFSASTIISDEELKNKDENKLTSLSLAISVFFVYFIPLNLFTADLNFSKGKKYLEAGDLKTAIPLLEKSTRLRPQEAIFHSYLGEAYAQTGQEEKAVEQAKITLDENPWHLNFYKSRAKIYLTLASLKPEYNEQAAEEIKKAYELSPTDAKLAYNLALVYSRIGEPDKSVEYLKQAINLKNTYYEPYYALSLLYEQADRLDELRDLLNKAQNNINPLPEPLATKVDKYL